MICTTCGQDTMRPGLTNFTYSKDDTVIVVKHVPAEVCANCGEAYLGQEAMERVWKLSRQAMESGNELTVHEYALPIAA